MSFKWYIVQAHSGQEKKVAESIKEDATRLGMQDHIEQIVVPVENMIEVKKGRKVNTEKKFFPGYVLVKMKMDERAWQMVKNVKKVSGFLGNKGKPQPVSQKEIDKIFKQIEEGIGNPKHMVLFEVGESVKVIDGPFESFVGVVEEIDEEKGKLKVSVSIFGRATPVELEYEQVDKV